MHSIRVSFQLLVSVLFIAVRTNTENFKFLLHLLYIVLHYILCRTSTLECEVQEKKENYTHANFSQFPEII